MTAAAMAVTTLALNHFHSMNFALCVSNSFDCCSSLPVVISFFCNSSKQRALLTSRYCKHLGIANSQVPNTDRYCKQSGCAMARIGALPLYLSFPMCAFPCSPSHVHPGPESFSAWEATEICLLTL